MTDGTSDTQAEQVTKPEAIGEQTLPEPVGEPAGDRLEIGDVFGRYVILSKLGAGTMGVVYAAYDPQLDRKVALKLLHARRGPRDSARTRLQREALALAKLAHPNVVGVHDVGVHRGQLFVSMEFVEGQTLREWIETEAGPRPWPEVVRVFSQAGRGLAAAHAAGLIHRDFKPDNVLLGDDGRVRVMDFGLARTRSERSSPADEPTLEQVRQTTSEALLEAPLTRTGATMGTPAYMSLEQLEAREVDARSDQFSFCAALHEGLYGQRPFVEDSLQARTWAILHGHLREAPPGSTVPRWLRKVVARGLAAKPARRWPAMDELLDALADDPALRRRRWSAGVGLTAALAAGTWGLIFANHRAPQACVGMEAPLEGVWDDARRGELEAALLETGLAYAPATWTRVERALDDYTQRWTTARVETCEASQRGEQSGELLDRRMACLDERLQHVRATVDVLASTDASIVDRAVKTVVGLPSLERCADVDALMAEQPPPEDPAVAERAAWLSEQLAELEALNRAGEYERGLTRAAGLVDEASALDHAPTRVRAWLVAGALYERASDWEAAEATLDKAYEAALAARLLPEAADASSYLIYVVGEKLARHDDGQRWAKHAKLLAKAAGTTAAQTHYLINHGNLALATGDLALARDHFSRALELREQTDGPEHLNLAGPLNNLARVAEYEADYALARSYQERSLAIYERALGPEHPTTATVYNNLGAITAMQGDFEEAQRRFTRALEIRERTLGPDHAYVASTLLNLGNVTRDQGDFEVARDYYERALAIDEARLGPAHPAVAQHLNNLATAERKLGEREQARRHLERALAIRVEALEPEHPAIAETLSNLGNLATEERDLARARDYHERALAIRLAAFGEEHPQVAISLVSLGYLARTADEYDQALTHYERALNIDERTLGSRHPYLMYSLGGLGNTLVDMGRADEALAHLERALELCTEGGLGPTEVASSRFALARALWGATADQGRDRDRALSLAESARDTYAALADAHPEIYAEIERWLSER